MKVAIITDDGTAISQHFGRAKFYLVASIDGGVIIDREMREKVGHGHFSLGEAGGHSHDHGHEQHGSDEGAHHKHGLMAQNIADCEAVICGGMGRGAYESIRSLNIRPIVTDLKTVNDALMAYMNNNLTDHTEKLH